MMRSIVCIAALTILSGHANAENRLEAEGNWNQWRGPSRDGTIQSNWFPSSLNETGLQRRWQVKLGPSYSGPLVIGDRVIVTETKDKRFEVVRALNRKTGEQLWEASWTGSMKVPFFAKANGSWIRSTPAYADGKIYVAGMRDVLVCLDAMDGRKIWSLDFVKEFGSNLPTFGFVSSPLVLGDSVFVQAGGCLTKLNKDTGKVVWKTLKDGGGMGGSAFASPYFTQIAGQDQLLVQTRSKLAGVDHQSGKVLWQKSIPASDWRTSGRRVGATSKEKPTAL